MKPNSSKILQYLICLCSILSISSGKALAQSFDLSGIDQPNQNSTQQQQRLDQQDTSGAQNSNQTAQGGSFLDSPIAEMTNPAPRSMGARGDSYHNSRPTTNQRITSLPPCTTAILSRNGSSGVGVITGNGGGFAALQNMSPEQLLAIQQKYGSLMNYVTGNSNPFGPMSLFNSGNSYNNPYNYGVGTFSQYFPSP